MAADGWDPSQRSRLPRQSHDRRARAPRRGQRQLPAHRHRQHGVLPERPSRERAEHRLRDGKRGRRRVRRRRVQAAVRHRLRRRPRHPRHAGRLRRSTTASTTSSPGTSGRRTRWCCSRSCRCRRRPSTRSSSPIAFTVPTGSRALAFPDDQPPCADRIGREAPGHPRRQRRRATTTATSPARGSITWRSRGPSRPSRCRRTCCSFATASTDKGPFAHFATRLPDVLAPGIHHGRHDDRPIRRAGRLAEHRRLRSAR